MIMEKKEQNSKTIQPLNEAELDEVNGGVYCLHSQTFSSNIRDERAKRDPSYRNPKEGNL